METLQKKLLMVCSALGMPNLHIARYTELPVDFIIGALRSNEVQKAIAKLRNTYKGSNADAIGELADQFSHAALEAMYSLTSVHTADEKVRLEASKTILQMSEFGRKGPDQEAKRSNGVLSEFDPQVLAQVEEATRKVRSMGGDAEGLSELDVMTLTPTEGFKSSWSEEGMKPED